MLERLVRVLFQNLVAVGRYMPERLVRVLIQNPVAVGR